MQQIDDINILDRIKLKIEYNSIDYDQLISIIKEYNMVISGSFLIQAITNKTFEFSDLDLYVIGDRNKILESKILNLIDKEVKFENQTNSYLKKYIGENIYEMMGINSVSTINFLNYFPSSQHKMFQEHIAKIQIIYINSEKFSNYVDFINTFDFEICSNYFDGDKLYCKNYEGIINNIAKYKTTNYCLSNRQFDRIKKYHKRNYNIIVIFDNEEYELNNFSGNAKNVMFIFGIGDKPTTNLLNNVEKLYLEENNQKEEIGNLRIILPNLPPSLKECYIINTFISKNRFMELTKIKIPFDCNVYFNNQIINQ